MADAEGAPEMMECEPAHDLSALQVDVGDPAVERFDLPDARRRVGCDGSRRCERGLAQQIAVVPTLGSSDLKDGRLPTFG